MTKAAYVAFYKSGSFVAAYPLGSSYKIEPEVVGCTAKLEYREFELCPTCGFPEHAGECEDDPGELTTPAAVLGSSRSAKKAAASRANGAKGGRPKKVETGA